MKGTTDIEGLRAAAARLVGGVVEQVRVPLDGGGRFGLQVRLTRLLDDGRRQVRRRWLAVHAPAWRLDRPAGVVAASGDRERRLAEDLAVLTGRAITGVHVLAPGWDTLFRFGELELTVFPLRHHTPSAAPDWTFRRPSGGRLVVGPGARWEMTA